MERREPVGRVARPGERPAMVVGAAADTEAEVPREVGVVRVLPEARVERVAATRASPSASLAPGPTDAAHPR